MVQLFTVDRQKQILVAAWTNDTKIVQISEDLQS